MYRLVTCAAIGSGRGKEHIGTYSLCLWTRQCNMEQALLSPNAIPHSILSHLTSVTAFQVNRKIDKQLKKDKKKYKSTHRLQLVGPAGSGKSTLITQVSARMAGL